MSTRLEELIRRLHSFDDAYHITLGQDLSNRKKNNRDIINLLEFNQHKSTVELNERLEVTEKELYRIKKQVYFDANLLIRKAEKEFENKLFRLFRLHIVNWIFACKVTINEGRKNRFPGIHYRLTITEKFNFKNSNLLQNRLNKMNQTRDLFNEYSHREIVYRILIKNKNLDRKTIYSDIVPGSAQPFYRIDDLFLSEYDLPESIDQFPDPQFVFELYRKKSKRKLDYPTYCYIYAMAQTKIYLYENHIKSSRGIIQTISKYILNSKDPERPKELHSNFRLNTINNWISFYCEYAFHSQKKN